ncbi:MAG: hypothetical protein RRZ93_05525, partial [Ruthenibacterium sp.]
MLLCADTGRERQVKKQTAAQIILQVRFMVPLLFFDGCCIDLANFSRFFKTKFHVGAFSRTFAATKTALRQEYFRKKRITQKVSRRKKAPNTGQFFAQRHF